MIFEGTQKRSASETLTFRLFLSKKIQLIEIIHRSQLADLVSCIIGWDKTKKFCSAYIWLGQNTETLYCIDPKYRNSVLPIFGWDRIQRLCIA